MDRGRIAEVGKVGEVGGGGVLVEGRRGWWLRERVRVTLVVRVFVGLDGGLDGGLVLGRFDG